MPSSIVSNASLTDEAWASIWTVVRFSIPLFSSSEM